MKELTMEEFYEEYHKRKRTTPEELLPKEVQKRREAKKVEFKNQAELNKYRKNELGIEPEPARKVNQEKLIKEAKQILPYLNKEGQDKLFKEINEIWIKEEYEDMPETYKIKMEKLFGKINWTTGEIL